ncbi:MAG: NAD+ synthase [Alteromonadaceae bacterium]|nr:MAG: NAD+ synthase [Alteromonadaceae bacterium]
MKVVSAQLNYVIGDLDTNTKKIKAVIAEQGNNVDLIVFSELCVTGYYPKDLLLRRGFIDAQDKAIELIRDESKTVKAGIVIGIIQKNPFAGKAFLNALELIENGQTIYQYHKQLLPTYGVFDEARHFEPGNQPGLVSWRGQRIGFLICEDAWENQSNPLYQRDPVAQLEKNRLDLIISINASPYNIYKRETRHGLVEAIAKRCQCPIVYVNQVGGIDDLVFDGNSLCYDAHGNCCYDGPLFKEAVDVIDTDNMQPVNIKPVSDMAIISDQVVMGLRDYCAKTGFTKVVIGSSGGIDSAVTLAVAVQAMGSENVIAITMPSQYSSAGSVDDSEALCEALGVQLINAPIKETFDTEVKAYTEAFGQAPSPLAQENLQARIRGQRLMTYSNTTGAMVVSTGNKTEMSVGYCTLYGDMAGGVSLLADLYKLQVYGLARYLNDVVFKREVIPQIIIDKEPSAELAPDQRDSDALPPYDQLDAFLQLLLEGDLLDDSEREKLKTKAFQLPEEDRLRVRMLLDRNEYKRRQAAPVIRVNRRSFGADRQIPLTARITEAR